MMSSTQANTTRGLWYLEKCSTAPSLFDCCPIACSTRDEMLSSCYLAWMTFKARRYITAVQRCLLGPKALLPALCQNTWSADLLHKPPHLARCTVRRHSRALHGQHTTASTHSAAQHLKGSIATLSSGSTPSFMFGSSLLELGVLLTNMVLDNEVHLITNAFLHRSRLSSKHTLIHSRCSRHNDAIFWHSDPRLH